MPKLFLTNLLFFIIVITSADIAVAQSSADTTVNGHAMYAAIENSFYKTIGPQARIYDGERYEFYSRQIKGSAYLFDTEDWSKGNVLYDGFWYRDVNMLYDLYKGKLIISLHNSFLKLTLLNEKVTAFDLPGHHFINLKTNPTDINPPHAGYYDVLYDGKIQLLCKRDKDIQEMHGLSEGNIESYFNYTADYYLYKNGRYYTVNSKGELLDALKDKKKILQQFISANKLKIKKADKEQAMVKIADYYDHLTN
jgi:hypothetical protein